MKKRKSSQQQICFNISKSDIPASRDDRLAVLLKIIFSNSRSAADFLDPTGLNLAPDHLSDCNIVFENIDDYVKLKHVLYS